MAVVTKTFGGRLRQAAYDTGSGQLDLQWDDGRVLAYAQVPQEVFRRLCSAPNPATYWEDRIAEEYPAARPRSGAAAGKTWSDLFGEPDPQ